MNFKVANLIDSKCQFTIGYGIANYEPNFTTGVYIGVGIIEIQRITYWIIEEKKMTENFGNTIGSGTSDYFNKLNYHYYIRAEEDIKEWGKVVNKFYEEYAVPFFEKYNSVNAVDKLLNEHPIVKVIYCDDLSWRIIKGLISAKLNQNPKYQELRDYYKSEVESKFQGYFMYEKCMKVIEFLDTHSLEELNEIANG